MRSVLSSAACIPLPVSCVLPMSVGKGPDGGRTHDTRGRGSGRTPERARGCSLCRPLSVFRRWRREFYRYPSERARMAVEPTTPEAAGGFRRLSLRRKDAMSAERMTRFVVPHRILGHGRLQTTRGVAEIPRADGRLEPSAAQRVPQVPSGNAGTDPPGCGLDTLEPRGGMREELALGVGPLCRDGLRIRKGVAQPPDTVSRSRSLVRVRL
jgi:hypothetical protein